VLSLGLALVGAAMVGKSIGLLTLTKSDLELRRLDYDLAGAQLVAAATVVRAGVAGPFHWVSTTDLGWIDVRAEQESSKLSLVAAAALPDSALAQFAVADGTALRSRLSAAAGADPVDIGSLDSAPLWRACAGRLVSSFGEQTSFTFTPDQDPPAGDRTPLWRVAQVWRIRITTAAGWRDDRLVRFTGNAQQPAATIIRTIAKGEGEGGRCESILQALSAN
jgi:hypothetical protein